MRTALDYTNLVYSQTIGPIQPGDVTPGENVVYPQDSLGETDGSNITFVSVFMWVLLISLLIGGIIGALYYYSNILKRKDRDEKSKLGVLIEVRAPRGNELEVGVAEKMFANLYGIGGAGKGIQKYLTVGNSISFEMVGLPGEIRFYVYAPKKLADLVEKQILGSYQEAEIIRTDEYNIFGENSKVAYASLVQTDEPYYPVKVAEDFSGDPLSNILSTLSKMEDGEGALIQLVISPAGSKWQKNGRKFVQKVEESNSDPEKKRISVSQEQLQAISKKTSKIGFRTAIRIVTSASDSDLANMHLNNIVGAFDQFSNPGINEFKKEKLNKLKGRDFMNDVIYRRMPLKSGSILNIDELASLFHLPNKEITTPNINWLLAKEAPAANWISSDVNSKDTIWLGDNVFRGNRKRICFQRDDRRRHAYVLGQTGSGKSWLLVRMILQDIYNGDGVCFIDPHGQTAQMVLDRIPHERAEDVIYFDVSDNQRPFGFNMMEFSDEQDKHRIVNGFIGLLKKIFDPHNQGIVGPILERTVRNAMLTAMSEKGSTLVEVLRIITDQKWVDEKWIPLIKDDMVKRFWTDQIAKTSDFHKSETLGYLTSKFDRFVTNLAVRNIIGQSQSSFNMREVMDNKKILIVNLSKGLVGEENMQFLGTILIPKLVAAALSREDIPEEERKDFFFYVDEFQNFATEEFASILSEARKYRLNLTVANQYIAQMEEHIKNSIFGNVGTLLIARTGPEDAKFLESQFDPVFTANDIMNQANLHWYVKLISGGKYPAPFSLDSSYGPSYPESGFDLPVNKEMSQKIRELSRLKYGRDVNVVEQEINQRAGLAVTEGSLADNQSGTPPLTLR
ncbi:type IV secretory system conjugative DNA transfer family protein [Candidatus Dojkabacteria bacterium]|nr:type IV secretory system conjugative DNA transfer family protein [Candidatus Dojkabacteria bacterium]